MARSWYTPIVLTILCSGIGCLTILAIPCRSMKFTWRAEPGHSSSFGMHVIDPAGNPTEEESYTLRIPLSELQRQISDEEILARFSRGFFAGWVFGPERWIAPFVQGVIDHQVFARARVTTRDLGDSYSSFQSGASACACTCDISRPSGMSQKHLPPLGACLFGLYYLIDASTYSAKDRESTFPDSVGIPRPGRSSVEYAGRTKGRSLAASHRFELLKDSPTVGEDDGGITIIYSHVRSNPRTGGHVYGRFMTAMHVSYAHLLFAEGVRELLASRSSV